MKRAKKSKYFWTMVLFAMIALFITRVVAEDIDSLRLFYTPEEQRTMLGVDAPVAEHARAGSDLVINSELLNRTENKSKRTPPQTKQHAAEFNGVSVAFNALMFSEAGIRVLLNGLPCLPVEHQRRGPGVEFRADINCPHLDKFNIQIRLQLSDLKIQVLKKGLSIGVLAVGKSL